MCTKATKAHAENVCSSKPLLFMIEAPECVSVMKSNAAIPLLWTLFFFINKPFIFEPFYRYTQKIVYCSLKERKAPSSFLRPYVPSSSFQIRRHAVIKLRQRSPDSFHNFIIFDQIKAVIAIDWTISMASEPFREQSLRVFRSFGVIMRKFGLWIMSSYSRYMTTDVKTSQLIMS